MRRRRVYLSGGMQYAAADGAGWRRAHTDWTELHLGHAVIDPVVESGRLLRSLRRRGLRLQGRDREGADWRKYFRTIVRHDIRLVRSSDYVVCVWNTAARRGAGTQGELTVARDRNIPVYLVSRTPRGSLPGWVQGCLTQHFRSMKDLRSYLRSRYAARSGET